MLEILKKIQIQKSLKKEIARYAISFFFAWLFSALISDFSFFKNLLIQSINLDDSLTKLLVGSSELILTTFGFECIVDGSFFQIKGTPGVVFAYGCLGFREIAFFAIFITFQTGSFRNKIWYIPLGTILLIILNLIRSLIIILGQYRNPNQFEIIHSIVSPIIMYPAILFLWILWLNTFGKVEKVPKKH